LVLNTGAFCTALHDVYGAKKIVATREFKLYGLSQGILLRFEDHLLEDLEIKKEIPA